MLLVFEKGMFFVVFFMENPLVSATIKCLNHGFCHVCAHLSKVNVIFRKCGFAFHALQLVITLEKNQTTCFFEKTWKNETFEEICLLGDILFLKKLVLPGPDFPNLPESAKIDHFETALTSQNLGGIALFFPFGQGGGLV